MSDDVAAAFDAGIERGVRTRMLEAAATAPFAYELGKKTVAQASNPHEYLAAAEQLGFAYQVARKQHLMDEQFDVIDVLGAIYARYPSIDSDASKVLAAKSMRRAARGFVSIGNMSRAAVALTNAAVALMEKSEVSEAEFRLIKRYLDFGFQHKQRSTVDWGYSEAALGMYYSQLPAHSREQRIANLEKAQECHDRALAIFAEHREIVPSGGQHIIARAERELYRERRAERAANALIEHSNELPSSAQRWASEMPHMIAGNIMVNPAVYGFEAVPGWLSEVLDSPPSHEEAERLKVSRDSLVAAIDNDSGSDYTAILESRWLAAELNVDLLNFEEAYQDLLDLIQANAGEFNPEKYIRRGSQVIGIAQRIGQRPPMDLLLNIATAFEKIAKQRDASRLEEFLQRNSARMRFVACELCEQGQWNSAISVIENSRVLLHAGHARESRECDLPSTDLAESPYWVYVTHSPNGTYVILAPTDDHGSATGVVLQDITGAKLSELHFSFADDSVGLMHAQSGGMSKKLAPATAKAFELLRALSDAIRTIVPNDRGVCLIIGGLYVTLPVSAVLSADNAAPYPYVVVVPSRSLTSCANYSLLLNRSRLTAMSVPIVSYVPEFSDLTYPDYEISALDGILSAVDVEVRAVKDAGIADCVDALEHSNIVHFSGHSIGNPFEPKYSSMLLRDYPYSVLQILEHPPVRNLLLATISSCQSGHQSTTVLADEVLGINTALLYRGCRFTLSTLWPVFDVASYVVTSRFFHELSRHSKIDIGSLYRSLTNTQMWVRTSTAAEIVDFFNAYGLEVPTMLDNQPATSVPFDHPIVWAAWYLSSLSL